MEFPPKIDLPRWDFRHTFDFTRITHFANFVMLVFAYGQFVAVLLGLVAFAKNVFWGWRAFFGEFGWHFGWKFGWHWDFVDLL